MRGGGGGTKIEAAYSEQRKIISERQLAVCEQQEAKRRLEYWVVNNAKEHRVNTSEQQIKIRKQKEKLLVGSGQAK